MMIRDARIDEMDEIRSMFMEYSNWINYEPCFESFQKELDELPGNYVSPDGALLVAEIDRALVGCAALEKIDNSKCEMKRVWVRDKYRGFNIGVSLINLLIDRAKEFGYKKMYLETIPKSKKALEIYASIGFRKIAKKDIIIVMEKNLID
jgi:carbonic anhydrase